MSDAAVSAGQTAMRRGAEILEDVKRKFPDLNDTEIVMLMAVVTGMAMGAQSFPERPVIDLTVLARVIGSAAGLALVRLQEKEKATCLGRA